ncbi:GAF domain-containing protein [Coleofasciculus sp. LEGE 07092]|nr:GAF domain-containing protein [Coleofasciculus sp. LEGE 07092]
MNALRILLLEDSLLDAELIEAHLADSGIDCELVRVESQTAFHSSLDCNSFDLILADYSLPSFDGISALEIARATCPDVPFIFVSATLGEELAIETLKGGATDYVLKQRLERLASSVKRALGEAKERIARKRAQEALRKLASELKVQVKERTEQGRRAAFLAETSTVLASSLDYETTLVVVAQLAIPYIADWCAVDILDKDNQILRRVAIAHADPAKVELAWELNRRYPDDLKTSMGLPKILRTGQSAIAPKISDAHLNLVAQNSEHLEILRSLGLTSCIIVPLLARERILGAMTFATAESGRHYGAVDRALVEDLARRAALAIDNAQLYSEAQNARQIAEQTAQRNASLQALTAALSEALTPTQVAEVGVEQGLAVLNASAGFMALLTDNHQSLEIVQGLGYSPSLLEDWKHVPLSAPVPIVDAIKSKKPILLESCQALGQVYPHLAQQYANTSHQAWVSIPLIVEGEAIGGMGLSFSESRTFSQDDYAFMWAVSQQCAQAIERARAYAAEQEARAEAEAASRAKDEFLAMLSHELRTPLNVILGWTQLLRTRQWDEAKRSQALETIERNTKGLGALIEDILDVSRIITGRLRLCQHPCDLSPIIEAAIETIRPTAEAKTIQIHRHFDASTGKVWGDANRLQQVVWNLLSNAIKFTPAGGEVTVRLAQSEGEVVGCPYAEIQVRDSGKGIAPNFLPHVFDRFRQENGGRTRSYNGLGLGLAIVRYLVEMHNGTVEVSSTGEGQGATFTIRLPLWVPSR